MKKSTFNFIKDILNDYEHTDEYIRQRESELKHPYLESDENIGGGRSNIPGIPVERMAITIATDRRLSNLERNKRVVDYCMSKSDERTVELITELYLKDRPTKTLLGVAEKIGYVERQARRKRNEFFEMVAKELGV